MKSSSLGTIIQGDCLEVMRGMADESVGLVVTSPPYNLRNSTGGGMDNPGASAKWPGFRLQADGGYDGYDDNRPEPEYQIWLRDVMEQVMRVLQWDGAAFVVFKCRPQGGLEQDRRWVWNQLPVRQTVIWARPKGHNFNPGYFVPSHELIYLICKPGFRLAPGANAHGTVWSFLAARGNDHPAPFPLELATRCIESAPDNGPVLDPFLGSGTTAVAAELLGRRWLGIEQSGEYCAMALRNVLEVVA